MDPAGELLDVGCFGFNQVSLTRQLGLNDVLEGFDYRRADLNAEPLPFEDDRFDVVVLAHVIEHIRDGARLFSECVRVTRPGGRLYVETPSERAVWLPGFPFKYDRFFSMSFFDDPTHVGRPWSPQSLHRLTRYLGCEPVQSGYRFTRAACCRSCCRSHGSGGAGTSSSASSGTPSAGPRI